LVYGFTRKCDGGARVFKARRDTVTGKGAKHMMLTEALEIVRGRYGLLPSPYLPANGKRMCVVAAERQLRAIPEVNDPNGGIAIFMHEVIDLARGAITIEALVRRKNPDLF
jgi:hypothetical protein